MNRIIVQDPRRGCQTPPRLALEEIARTQGWGPAIAQARPFPPLPYVLRGPVELICRLAASGSGRNYWFALGDGAREAKNQAPAYPMFRASVEAFHWFPPPTKDCPWVGSWGFGPDLVPDMARQGGNQCVNWEARGVKPLPDPVGELLQTLRDSPLEPPLAPAFGLGDPALRQGRLLLWEQSAVETVYASLPQEGVADVVTALQERLGWAGSGTRLLFNHIFMGASRWAYRVFPDGVARGLVAGEGFYILSADHPEEGLGPLAGIWAFAHPRPTSRGGD